MDQLSNKIIRSINLCFLKRKFDLSFGPIFKDERTFYPLKESQLAVLETPTEIIKILDEEGYYCPDYRQGYAYKKDDLSKKKPPVKILKVLSKKLLLKDKNSDKYNELKKKFETRLSANRKENIKCKICITHNPFDVALMSTNRSWTSCMDLNDGYYKTTPLKQVQYGGMCAYLIKENDNKVEDPIARIAIKRLVGDSCQQDFIFASENKVYGDSSFAKELNFEKNVIDILNKSNKFTAGKSRLFKRKDRGSYSDADIDKIYKFNFSTEEEMIKYVKKNFGILSNSYFYQGASMFDDINKFLLSDVFIDHFKGSINWYYLCQYQKLSYEFIEKYKSHVSWSSICQYQELKESFIEKYKDKVDWSNISEFQKLSEEFIEKYKRRVNWNFISSDQKLSESFIRKHKNKLQWGFISEYQKLSEKFIEEFKRKVCWFTISCHQKLSEEFIEKYKNKLSWDEMSEHQKLSEEFIEKHKNDVTMEKIFKYQNVSDNFKRRMKKYL